MIWDLQWCFISVTELFVVMNSSVITERNKNQWIYQWICNIQIIWKLSYIHLWKTIAFEPFEPWTLLIVFLFLVLIISIWLTIKPINLRKFYFQIKKKRQDQTSIFAEAVLENHSCSSVHLSVCLWHNFLRIYSVDFLDFLHDYIFPYTKKWQS